MSVPIFVISCKDSLERRQHVHRELQSLNLPWEFVDAVDLREASYADIEDVYDRRKALGHGGGMSPSEIGCYLSHLKVYELMRERGIERAVVAEDDFRLLSRYKDDAASIITALADASLKWDILQIGAHIKRFPPISRHYAQPIPWGEGALHISRYQHTATNSSFYMIDRAYAETLLEWHRQHKIFLSLDIMLFDMTYALRFAHILCASRLRGWGGFARRRLAGQSNKFDPIVTRPQEMPGALRSDAVVPNLIARLRSIARLGKVGLLNCYDWFAGGRAWSDRAKLHYAEVPERPSDWQLRRIYVAPRHRHLPH